MRGYYNNNYIYTKNKRYIMLSMQYNAALFVIINKIIIAEISESVFVRVCF
jgi:hypothetical protein